MISTYNLGLYSEFIASCFLRIKRYKILERRLRNYSGEIDIIAAKGNMIVFVEVKTIRENNRLLPAVGNKQINRIKRAAMIYLNRGYYSNYDVRFDLITVFNMVFIRHYKNVF